MSAEFLPNFAKFMPNFIYNFFVSGILNKYKHEDIGDKNEDVNWWIRIIFKIIPFLYYSAYIYHCEFSYKSHST